MKSRGQRNPFDDRPGTDSATWVPGTAGLPPAAVSETVLPTGTAPGCHVTIARPSGAAGSGAATTTPVVAAVAEAAPPLPVAVTTSESVEPMSSGVSVRRGPIAGGIAMQDVPAALQRRQRYVNLVGEPVQVPTELVRVCPSWTVPTICGGLRFCGRAVGEVPAGATAAVAAVVATALPAAEVAVTTTLSECPTAVLSGRYDSPVAPVIDAQLAPAASQSLHWYANVSGLPPAQVPGTAARSSPASGAPTIVGGVERSGMPIGYGAIATEAGFVPFIRSPSVQWLIPGTETQLVHCQNVQPPPFQFPAGTNGLLLAVQCAIQRPVPAAAAAGESPRRPLQKSGEV